MKRVSLNEEDQSTKMRALVRMPLHAPYVEVGVITE